MRIQIHEFSNATSLCLSVTTMRRLTLNCTVDVGTSQTNATLHSITGSDVFTPFCYADEEENLALADELLMHSASIHL